MRPRFFGTPSCPTGEKGGYIPYRDSKLTRLLQPSLGGNAKITIICTVTGALMSSDETHNTLKFANRAKRMKNHAAVNEVSNDKVGLALVCFSLTFSPLGLGRKRYRYDNCGD